MPAHDFNFTTIDGKPIDTLEDLKKVALNKLESDKIVRAGILIVMA